MSGQDATLSIKEAKAQQERTCAGGNDQGPKKPSMSVDTSVMKKQKNQG